MYRICKAHGLLLEKKRGQRQKFKRICNNRNITGPDQLWQFDIKYGFIPGENRYFYICGFIDVFTRKLIDYHIGLRCTAADILTTLKSALLQRQISLDHHLIIRSDNGPQMSSRKFAAELESLPCDHEFIPLATPNKNAFIESFFSILESALLAKSYFMTYAEAYEEVSNFIGFYNTKRIHGVIKMSPNELETAWRESKLVGDYAISA